MHKALLIITIGLLLVGGSIWWLQAGQTQSTPPAIAAPTATPNVITVSTSTQVLFTVSIPEPTLDLASVNLLRINADGTSTVVAPMVDNGQNGDQKPGDKMFTARLTLNEPQAGDLRFQVSAAFRGILRRALSPLTSLRVLNGPEQTLLTIANLLDSGNLDATLTYFSPSQINKEVLSTLTPTQRSRLAAGLRGARLLTNTGKIRTFEVSGVVDGVPPREMSMSQTSSGEWVIISW